ncbi:MAG: hypothetical protein GY727_15235 [Gammaproteobacteria bacterium]|nr:hypothetical protein [Gammaproteobacteria bacterium]
MNVSECFDRGSSNGTSGNVSPFVYSGDGKIGGQSGRPDGGLYDSIKAGQIKDLRIDASGTHTPQTAHHTLSKRARNGEARGWEKLPRIRWAFAAASTVNTGTAFALKVARGDAQVLGDISKIGTSPTQKSSGWLIRADGSVHKIFNVFDNGDHIFLRSHTLPANGVSTGSEVVQAVFGDYIDAPYSEGLFQNVVGHPSVIASFIASTSFGGIMGEWLPVIPDNVHGKQYKGTKKLLEQYPSLYSQDGGVTWGSTGWNFDNTDNTQLGRMDNTNDLRIICYKAKANFTEEMAIDNQPFVYADYMTEYNARETVTWGSVLSQSLHNTIPTGTNSKSAAKTPLIDIFPSNVWKIYHTQHSILAGTVEGSISGSSVSEGTQWEGRLHSKDSLASLAIAYRQIKHDGSSYGAGLAFRYVNNTSNTTDDNGQLIQVGSARSIDDLNIILKENFNA